MSGPIHQDLKTPRLEAASPFLLLQQLSPVRRLEGMTLMNFLCRLFPGRCEPPKTEEPAAPKTGADLGQKEAKNEALREEQLRHMEGGGADRSAQRRHLSE